jgi:hypothetical protein
MENLFCGFFRSSELKLHTGFLSCFFYGLSLFTYHLLNGAFWYYKVSSIAFERKSLTINLLRVFLSRCLVNGFHRVCDVLGFTLD